MQKGGPVKLFVPYTKAKRKRRDGEGSVSKRLSTSGEEALKGGCFCFCIKDFALHPLLITLHSNYL